MVTGLFAGFGAVLDVLKCPQKQKIFREEDMGMGVGNCGVAWLPERVARNRTNVLKIL